MPIVPYCNGKENGKESGTQESQWMLDPFLSPLVSTVCLYRTDFLTYCLATVAMETLKVKNTKIC